MKTGYRSPLRPIPANAIPEFSNYQIQEERDDGESMVVDNCMKDEWWFEVIRVANEFESMPQRIDLVDLVRSIASLVF